MYIIYMYVLLLVRGLRTVFIFSSNKMKKSGNKQWNIIMLKVNQKFPKWRYRKRKSKG